jgi:histidine triad (HIT) family protein
MSDCIFCRILSGATPGTFVHKDDRCAAFLDIQPINEGHLLVVPLTHAPHLADLDEATAGHLMGVAHRLGAALGKSGLPCEGLNLFLADGKVAMQEVLHVHLHVFPRTRRDGFGLRLGPEYGVRPSRADLEAAGARIRKSLQRT